MGNLNHQQAAFVREYLKCGNATKAALKAGYSRRTSYAQGCRLLKHAEIRKSLAAKVEKAELTADRVLEEIRRLAFSDVRSLFHENGDLKDITELTEDQAACIGGLEVLIKNAKAGDGITDTIHKIKIWDKTKSLELLAKYFKLLTDVVEHKFSLEDLVAGSREPEK